MSLGQVCDSDSKRQWSAGSIKGGIKTFSGLGDILIIQRVLVGITKVLGPAGGNQMITCGTTSVLAVEEL